VTLTLNAAETLALQNNLALGTTAVYGSAFTGKSYSYGWWIVAFQLFGLLYAAYVAAAAPAKKLGAVGLMTVLTTSTFLFTADVAGAPLGAYALSHNKSGTPASVTGTKGGLIKNGVFVMFAGLVIVDIANAVLTITLDDETDPAPAAAAPAKEAAAEAPAAEAAV